MHTRQANQYNYVRSQHEGTCKGGGFGFGCGYFWGSALRNVALTLCVFAIVVHESVYNFEHDIVVGGAMFFGASLEKCANFDTRGLCVAH